MNISGLCVYLSYENRTATTQNRFCCHLRLLAILPVLAYLQYTWLGQLATQESVKCVRMYVHQLSCAMDFGEEMVGLLKALGGLYLVPTRAPEM